MKDFNSKPLFTYKTAVKYKKKINEFHISLTSHVYILYKGVEQLRYRLTFIA